VKKYGVGLSRAPWKVSTIAQNGRQQQW